MRLGFGQVLDSLPRSALFVFALAAGIRTIPEVLAGKFPVGFDVNAYYPYLILSFPSTPITDLLRAGPLFYGVLWAVQAGTRADVFFLLKISGPVIYGLLSASFLIFLVQFLKLSFQKATFGTVLLVLQPIALRISWDLFRNEIGLAMGLLALTSLRADWKNKFALAAAFGVLAVLAHPLSAVLMFAGVLGIFLFSTKARRDRLTILGTFVPSAVLFLASSLIFFLVPVQGQSQIVTLSADPNSLSRAVLYSSFLSQDGFLGPAHQDAIQHALLLFAFSFLPILFFAVRGFWSEPAVAAITGWLGLASFSFVVSPILSIPIYWRWEILLIFPFAIYAVKGLDRLSFFRPARWTVRAVLAGVFLVLALGYATGWFSYMGVYGVNSFAPGTMVQGSLAESQVQSTMASLTWLKSYAPANSVVLSDERFISYEYLTVGNSVRIFVQPGSVPSNNAVSQVEAFRPAAFFVIWDSPLALTGFSPIHTDNGITILQYGPS